MQKLAVTTMIDSAAMKQVHLITIFPYAISSVTSDFLSYDDLPPGGFPSGRFVNMANIYLTHPPIERVQHERHGDQPSRYREPQPLY